MLTILKQEPRTDHPEADPTPEPLGPLRVGCSPELTNQDRDRDMLKPKAPLLPLHASSPPPQQAERREEVREDEKKEEQIKMEASSYSGHMAYSLPPLPLSEAQPKPELVKDPEGYPTCASADPQSRESAQTCSTQEPASSAAACSLTRPDTPINLLTPSPQEAVGETSECPPPTSTSPPPLVIGAEDPMAGMFALLTASEMASARPGTPPAPTLLPQTEDPSAVPDTTGALEMVALEGMALLSQMAQQEMESISQEHGE